MLCDPIVFAPMLGSFHMLHILPLKMTFSACVWHNEFHMFTTVMNKNGHLKILFKPHIGLNCLLSVLSDF